METSQGNGMTLDRAAGCLLGLACGDAVGAAVEFLPRGRFASLTDMVGGGAFRLEPGQWTDDTSMALCLADSLLECGGFDPLDQMSRYRRWVETGYNSSRPKAFGLGKVVAKALFGFTRTGDPFSGPTESRHSGNGSLMRLAPVPLFYVRDLRAAVEFASESSRTTHGSQECLQSCRCFAALLVRALEGCSKEEIFRLDEALFPQPLDHLGHVLSMEFAHKGAEEIRGSGYVIESLEAALWAFWHTESFEAAVLAAANLGDDADTTAAICGQLAGAHYGREAIPPGWLAKLHRMQEIEDIAIRLALAGPKGF